MQQTNKKVLALTAIATAIMLSACGGGGSGNSGSIGSPSTPNTGGSSSAETLTVLSGNSIVVPGTISTSITLLQSMKWTVSPQTANAAALVLSNDTCGVATKNDQVFTPVPGSVSTGKTGESTWTCELGIVAPKGITADTSYKLLLSATDDKGNTITKESVLKVQPNPNASSGSTGTSTVSAGKDFSVLVGKSAPLSCDAPANSTYQWVVTDNGGLPLTLSSYNTQNTEFTAPAVSTPTKVTVTCRATDTSNNVQTSSVNVTINPVTNDISLNAQIPSGVVGSPGQSIVIASNTSWYDTTGKATTGPVITYNWTLGANVPSNVSLLSNGTSSTQLYVTPGSITQPITVPVTLTATSNGQTSSTTVSVLVDPFGTLVPTVTPPAQAVESGKSVSISATSGTNLYYQWTQVSGIPVILGGQQTATVGFVGPSVTSPQDVVLRVAIGYAPITAQNPGVYFADAAIQVQPPKN